MIYGGKFFGKYQVMGAEPSWWGSFPKSLERPCFLCLSVSVMRGHCEQASPASQEGTLTKNQIRRQPDLRPPVSRTMKNKCPCHSVYGNLLKQAERTDTQITFISMPAWMQIHTHTHKFSRLQRCSNTANMLLHISQLLCIIHLSNRRGNLSTLFEWYSINFKI